jgi:lipopolysaccharide transport system permease protein
MTAHTELVALEPPPVQELTAPPPRSAHRVRIEPAQRWPRPNVGELWASRELLLFLVWRDVKVRYAQTVLGAGWAILQPVMATLVFTVVFGRFARIPSNGAPYPVFALAALVPWTYFATALTGASNSLVGNRNLLTKVYFPRLAIPLASVLAGLVDVAIALVVLLAALAWYGITPSPWALVVVPILLTLAATTAAGVGSLLAALNVQYRDVRQLTPFLVQIWMYASPVVYPLTLVPAEYRLLYALNPMVGVIAGTRAVLLDRTAMPWPEVLVGLVVSVVLLACGMFFFRHTERVFADVA